MFGLLVIIFFVICIVFIISITVLHQGQKGDNSGWIKGPCIANNKICGPSSQTRTCKNVIDMMMGNCTSDVTEKCSTLTKLIGGCNTDTITCASIECCKQSDAMKVTTCGPGCNLITKKQITSNMPGSPPCSPSTYFKCADGYIPDPSGKIGCIKCPPNTFQDGKSCTKCTLDKVSISGSTKCICKNGFKLNNNGTCVKCPAGQIGKNNSCFPCQAGLYSSQPGSSACVPCSPGTYSKAGSKKCIPCSIGTYSNEDSSDCIACSPGSYSNKSGLSKCISCSAGFYQSNSGQSYCSPCPAGTIAPKSGASMCTRCQDNCWNDKTGKQKCSFPLNSNGITCSPIGDYQVYDSKVCRKFEVKSECPFSDKLCSNLFSGTLDCPAFTSFCNSSNVIKNMNNGRYFQCCQCAANN